MRISCQKYGRKVRRCMDVCNG